MMNIVLVFMFSSSWARIPSDWVWLHRLVEWVSESRQIIKLAKSFVCRWTILLALHFTLEYAQVDSPLLQWSFQTICIHTLLVRMNDKQRHGQQILLDSLCSSIHRTAMIRQSRAWNVLKANEIKLVPALVVEDNLNWSTRTLKS